MLPEFRNEPFTDFSVDANANAFRAALAAVEKAASAQGQEPDRRQGLRRLEGLRVAQSLATSNRSSVASRRAPRPTGRGPSTPRRKPSRAWSRTPHGERSALVLRIASILRRRKHEFSAMMVLEESKSWAEADGDTAEAIDFCEFYAREMERLALPQPLTPYPGEYNELEHIPLGVAVVIPPWNFPLAILTGMTTAALVAGNTVVLKPSSDAAGIASMFLDACDEAGVPDGVLNFLTGGGATVGNALVEHPKTRLIAFTGSRDVGLQVSREGRPRRPGADLDQAGHPRDGRQGLHSRRRDGGHRGRRQRNRGGGVRLPGTEMLGLLAPDRPPEGPQGPARARRREDEGALGRRRARPEEHRRRRHQCARPQEDPRVRGPRKEGRPRRRRREGRPEAGLLRHAHRRRRRRAQRAPGLRGDLRSGPLGAEGPHASRKASRSQTTRSTA